MLWHAPVVKAVVVALRMMHMHAFNTHSEEDMQNVRQNMTAIRVLIPLKDI